MIYNFTQHAPTPEQVEAGVINLPDEQRSTLFNLLNFDEVPAIGFVEARAKHIAAIAFAIDAKAVMIGGDPYLMPALDAALKAYGIKVLYSFSQRVSVEATDESGSVAKTSVFKHIGFVEV